MSSKKGGIGGFLKAKKSGSSSNNKKKVVKESDLLAKETPITPEDVLALAGPTEEYLCKTTANTFGIEFVAFSLRDLDKNATLAELKKPEDAPYEPPTEQDDDSGRFVQYDFTEAFLNLKTVGMT